MKKLLIALLFSANVFALEPEQVTALHDYALTDPIAAVCLNNGDDGCLQNYLNTPTTFYAWKTRVTQDEILGSLDFNWTRVDNLTVGKDRIWRYMFANQGGSINASNANIRLGIDAVWVGTAADLLVRTSVYSMCKRVTTVAERTLAIGIGTQAIPGSMTFEGYISMDDAIHIRVGN